MALLSFISWSATLSNIFFFSTGIITCRKIILKNSTENIPHLPFLITSFCSFMWTVYGITKRDSTIVFVNTIGVLLQCTYLIIHFVYSKTERVFRHTMYIVLLTCSLLAYFKLYISDEQESISKLGLACVIITVIMFGSPLGTLVKIFQTQSTQTLSFPLSLMTVVNAGLWLTYGYLVQDVFLMIPNVLGLMMGLIQLALFCIFPENAKPIIERELEWQLKDILPELETKFAQLSLVKSMTEKQQLTRFWLELFKASCHLKQESEDDIRPLCDYLTPKAKFSLDKQITQPQQSSVKFLNLKKCYEKIQTRRDGISAQRPMDCNIRMLAIFDPEWTSRSIDVFVQRHPESARLCGDMNGKVNLKLKYEEKQDNREYFSVDLDSVYKSQYDIPVYKLSTVDPIRRNRFLLIVRLSSCEQNKYEYFTSSPFLVRSRRPHSCATMELNSSKKMKLSLGNKRQ